MVDVGGKPLIAHSIAHALAATSITRTIVSTEDEEIRGVALKHGAEVPFPRPKSLAGDHVLDQPVFEHVLNELNAREGYRPDLIVHLRPTAPLRRPEWIDQAVGILRDHPGADSIRSVSPPAMHPYRVFRIGDDGYLVPVMRHEHAEPYLLRRQNLPEMYYYNCVVDVTRPSTILEQQSMTGTHMLPFVMDTDVAFDIDTARDLEIVRLFAEGFNQ